MIDERRKDLAPSLESARDLLDVVLLDSRNHPEIGETGILATIRSVRFNYSSLENILTVVAFYCWISDFVRYT